MGVISKYQKVLKFQTYTANIVSSSQFQFQHLIKFSPFACTTLDVVVCANDIDKRR